MGKMLGYPKEGPKYDELPGEKCTCCEGRGRRPVRVGAVLRKWRQRYGVSLVQVSDALKTPRQTIGCYEDSSRTPTPSMFERYVRAVAKIAEDRGLEVAREEGGA